MATVDHSLNGTHGNKALSKGLACYYQGNYVGHLQTQAIEEGLNITQNLVAIAPTNVFANHTDEEADKHSHNDVHLNPGDPQGAEAQN